jgi:hypothetical protein
LNDDDTMQSPIKIGTPLSFKPAIMVIADPFQASSPSINPRVRL